MKPIDVIREVKLKANGQWQAILSHLGAEVPLNTHTACPACGGKDRFRFDITARLFVISVVQVMGWI